MSRAAAVAPTPKIEPVPTAPTKCACGGRIEPYTNGNGTLVDRCASCYALRGHGTAPSRGLVPVPPRRCAIDGCEGLLDSAAGCQCCSRRDAWKAEHFPKKVCEICRAPIANARGRSKYCKACAPLARIVRWRDKARRYRADDAA